MGWSSISISQGPFPFILRRATCGFDRRRVVLLLPAGQKRAYWVRETALAVAKMSGNP